MKVGSLRFFTRLHLIATAVILAVLWMPLLADASEAKKANKKSGKAATSQAAGRDKPSSQRAKAAAKKGKSSKSEALASKPRKSQAKKPVQLAKKEQGVSKRKSASRKTVAHARTATAGRNGRAAVVARKAGAKAPVHAAARKKQPNVVRVVAAPRLTTGERLGLRDSEDALDLNSSVALVIDQETNEVLFSKNDAAVLPIASLTKLMTGLVITDANLPMDEVLTITRDDVDRVKGSGSRLAVGSELTRGELMHLALMSSENRAAHALGRTYPGGLNHFVRLMNAKARELGMRDTRYVEPTGLSSLNQSSARDLATLVSVAYERPILRSLSTSPSHLLDVGHRTLEYRNSNRLIRDPHWEIGLQKTGYISEAGRCLVMQAKVAGRQLIMVFLDSAGKVSRAQDAERVRRWVEAQTYLQPLARPQG
jgi:D-alanyl-D-alanine endopeptidase (penicillin-binding protein 7)